MSDGITDALRSGRQTRRHSCGCLHESPVGRSGYRLRSKCRGCKREEELKEKWDEDGMVEAFAHGQSPSEWEENQ